jgi:hypothetical protein
MSDDFLLGGLRDDGWFGSKFEKYVLFGYVGDGERLTREIESKPIWRKMVETVFLRVPLDIGTLIRAFTGIDLGRVSSDSSLAKELFDLSEKARKDKALASYLAHVYSRGQKKGTYFDHVSMMEYQKRRLFDPEQSMKLLEGRLISVEGQLVNRKTIAQYSGAFDATLKASGGEWTLADFPPYALQKDNQQFNGNLTEDSGFTRTFGRDLPFSTEIGWYPCIKTTGFFTAARLAREKLPSLSISLVEYRPPQQHFNMRA